MVYSLLDPGIQCDKCSSISEPICRARALELRSLKASSARLPPSPPRPPGPLATASGDALEKEKPKEAKQLQIVWLYLRFCISKGKGKIIDIKFEVAIYKVELLDGFHKGKKFYLIGEELKKNFKQENNQNENV